MANISHKYFIRYNDNDKIRPLINLASPNGGIF